MEHVSHAFHAFHLYLQRVPKFHLCLVNLVGSCGPLRAAGRVTLQGLKHVLLRRLCEPVHQVHKSIVELVITCYITVITGCKFAVNL